MMLVDVLINIISRGYYSPKSLMDFDLEDDSDFHLVKIIGAVQVFRDESQKEEILTLFLVRDYKTQYIDPEKEKKQQDQLQFLGKERSIIDMYQHLKSELLDQGFLHLSNAELAPDLYDRYKIRMPGLRMIKHGAGQWIILPQGREKVRVIFQERESKLKAELEELSKAISQI